MGREIDIDYIVATVQEKFHAARNMLRLLEAERESIHKLPNTSNVVRTLLSCNTAAVRTLLVDNALATRPLREWPTNKIRILAKKLGIQYYGSCSRSELLKELTDERIGELVTYLVHSESPLLETSEIFELVTRREREAGRIPSGSEKACEYIPDYQI